VALAASPARASGRTEVADKRLVHLYHRAPDGRTIKLHMYLPHAVHVVRNHPSTFSTDGNFVGERPPPPSEGQAKAIGRWTGRMRPWQHPF
jgi:hypothetical protein